MYFVYAQSLLMTWSDCLGYRKFFRGKKLHLLWQEDVFCIPAIIIDDVVQARSGGVIHQTMR